MAEVTTGQRVGGFVVFRDEDGLRHAVRQGAILAISDADETGSITAVQLTGNRTAVVRQGFDQVLGWFA
jgi:hypothetical protein